MPRGAHVSQSSATDDRRTAWLLRWRRTIAYAVSTCWVYQAIALVALGVWILADGRFPQAARDLHGNLAGLLHGEGDSLRTAYAARLRWLEILLGGGVLTFVGLLLGMFVSVPRHRRVHSWLAATAVAVGWLTLATAWPQLAWQGQQWRLTRELEQFERVAAPLRESWPAEDGESTTLGPFMAYPRGKPRMLMVLSTPDQATTPISAVERSRDEALRFELAGAESGAWLEWHPARSVPRSFIGGLGAEYCLLRYAYLADGWYSVNYSTEGSSRTGSLALPRSPRS